MAEKYSHIDFTPPAGVRAAAERGLALRSEHGRGGTEVGIARGRDLSNGVAVSPDTIRRMVSYFARHEVDKQGEGWGDTNNPSNGYIAWLLWGGDAGRAWAEKVARQMDAADADDAAKTAWAYRAYANYLKRPVSTVKCACAAALPAAELWVTGRGAVKALDTLEAAAETVGRVGGYLVAFGKPYDQHNEYFDPDANFYLDYYSNQPVFFRHGMTEDIGTEVVGRITCIERREDGLWAEAEIDLTSPYGRRVYDLVRRGGIGWSSGSVAHLVRKDQDGRIYEWPIVEASLTPDPAETVRTTAVAMREACKALLADAARETDISAWAWACVAAYKARKCGRALVGSVVSTLDTTCTLSRKMRT